MVSDHSASDDRLPRRASDDRLPRRAGDDRGQLILVGAVVLAIAIVGLVVILNTVLYTQNVTNRAALDATDDAAEIERAVDGEVPPLVERTNRNATYGNESAAADAVNRTLARYGALVGTAVTNRRPASVGVAVAGNPSVALVVADANSSRNFTDRAGDPEWTVADGASVQRYRLRVDADSLPSTDADAFRVTVAAGGDDWTMRVHRNGSSVDVDRVGTGGAESTCTASPDDGTVELDVDDGSVDVEGDSAGVDCTFAFAAGVDPPYELGYANATNATGTYRLVLDGTGATAGDVATAAPWESPYRSYAVDALAVTVTYATPELRYRTTTNHTIHDP
ncbi:DUF7261 family protein [Halorussus halobius]|uniref:DUF7261 family protein n=1 Tax=Halorussus halobius TaxID=1710537 RepID=UPI001092B85A|nr:hypothetical protein [Halorussus halobius]